MTRGEVQVLAAGSRVLGAGGRGRGKPVVGEERNSVLAWCQRQLLIYGALNICLMFTL